VRGGGAWVKGPFSLTKKRDGRGGTAGDINLYMVEGMGEKRKKEEKGGGQRGGKKGIN